MLLGQLATGRSPVPALLWLASAVAAAAALCWALTISSAWRMTAEILMEVWFSR
jgi:hypothetical protein